MLKKIIFSLLPLSVIKQLLNLKKLIIDYGQYRSMREGNCVDNFGNLLPWYTYPAIEYLNNIDFTKKKIFEYGAGNSSIYWAGKAESVTSVEHSIEWYQKIISSTKNNQEILLREDPTEYIEAISSVNKQFDVIIIDGIERESCSKKVASLFEGNFPEGIMVILDNSDWYQDVASFFREDLGLIEIDFHGFGPINGFTWTTSIFITRNFNFKPINGFQPNVSIAGSRLSEGERP